ncbi:NTF2-like protein [Piromyces finnis]|uniref:NTF2-like protein n=1 Tax=Piromyces finnis TaxID=1754191 RepID=A0A1Y1V805_9FUNG|nr:NTF2-like protein [Piromyces finnis]|eukprot:ORX48971.1 NTF2-like protein [Piromyces finnis]
MGRYNPENQYLNLENINNDPALGDKRGLVDLNKSEKLGQVICKLIKENFPDVKTISFANNNLRNLRALSKLHQWLPDVMNLSFQNNQLATLRDIEPINGDKFTGLRELVISENPVKDKEMQKFGNFENLKSQIKSMFPSLLILDNEELPEGISFDVGKNINSKTLPLQIMSSFVDSDVTANTIQDFIVKYFTLFDTNRVGLLDLYDDNALFSLSINNNIPSWRKRFERGNMSNWKAYDRNFKSTRQSLRDNLLSKGKNAIIQTIAKLPSTKHPLEDNSKFIIDSWQINVAPQQILIYLNISGEFKEVDVKLNKSFSRTFLIAPSQPQSNAANAGWAYTIFNDQMTVRPWSGNKSFDKAKANPIQIDISGSAKMLNNNNNNSNTSNVFNAAAQLNTNIPVSNGPLEFTPLQLQEQEQLRIQHGLNEIQHQQVQELSRQTRLTYLYSIQCLNEFQWNFASALEGYQKVKNQVPPDGYYH